MDAKPMLAVFSYAAGGITGHKKSVATSGHTYPVDNNRYICGYYSISVLGLQDLINATPISGNCPNEGTPIKI